VVNPFSRKKGKDLIDPENKEGRREMQLLLAEARGVFLI